MYQGVLYRSNCKSHKNYCYFMHLLLLINMFEFRYRFCRFFTNIFNFLLYFSLIMWKNYHYGDWLLKFFLNLFHVNDCQKSIHLITSNIY